MILQKSIRKSIFFFFFFFPLEDERFRHFLKNFLSIFEIFVRNNRVIHNDQQSTSIYSYTLITISFDRKSKDEINWIELME